MYSREQLLQNATFLHFDELCRIPHISGREQEISDYLLAWAQDLGLAAEQDDHFNLYIQKPATPGYESAPVVMLQAHLDMVGSGSKGVNVNFEKDAIQWMIEENTITTGGKTTLGADDGIGVALAMTVLEDKIHAHPAIEVALTTMEEVDFSGAESFRFPFRASSLINLDGSYDNQLLCASSGGMAAEIRLPLERVTLPEANRCMRIAISGLAGGHSGREINRGRDNAIRILGRFLLQIKKMFPFVISDLKGGDSYIALARDAQADLVLAAGDIPELEKKAAELEETLHKEHPITGEKIRVSLDDCKEPSHAYKAEPIIMMLNLSPDGIVQMNEMFPDIVASSVNMGTARMKEGVLTLKYDIRSFSEKMGQSTYEKLELLAGLAGAGCRQSTSYPSWDLRADSVLRDTASAVYRRMYGEEPEVCSIHVGLEVGYFFLKKAGIDAIAYGPNRWNNHSPSEGMSIPSVYKAEEYLFALLSELRLVNSGMLD